MKKCFKYMVMLTVLVLSACTAEEFDGEGYLALSLELTTAQDAPAVTRTLPTVEELNNSCAIKIRNGLGGLIREYSGLNNVPSQLQLVTGMYAVEATAGTKVDVAFDAPYYEGKTNFEIRKGEITPITLPVYLQNTLVKMEYSPVAAAKFTSCIVTVSMSKGSLEFVKGEDQTGYYIMPKGETELDWTLRATTKEGLSHSTSGVIKNVKSATKYTLKFDYQELEPEDGGMFLDITVADEPVDPRECVITIGRAPTIERLENDEYFSLEDPLNFTTNDEGRDVVVAVRTSAELKSFRLSCPEFKTKLGLDFESIDIHTVADNVRAPLKNKGINYASEYDVANDFSIAQLSFTKTFFQFFTQGDSEGTYNIELTATDANARVRTAILQVMVSNAIVNTTIINDYEVWATKATVYANVNRALYDALQDDAAKTITFQYRKKGTDDWQEIAADLNGNTMNAQLMGLTPSTTYQYRADCAGQTAEASIREFTTEAALPLPNAGFEGWQKSDKVWLLYGAGESMFWDSGNHGSATLNVNVTNYDESVKAPGTAGTRSVKMVSQFVSLLGIGKFAAGNAFVGKYLGTDGTDGILGFGRPFTSRPIKLRGYIKYKMQTISHTSLSNVTKGMNDNAHIYMAIGDWANETGDAESPILIKTKSSELKLFDSTGPGVIAFGEMFLTDSTEGEGMIPFEITLNYRDQTRKAKYLLLTASASRYGDYFTGGEGSTLWLDDLELVYE